MYVFNSLIFFLTFSREFSYQSPSSSSSLYATLLLRLCKAAARASAIEGGPPPLPPDGALGPDPEDPDSCSNTEGFSNCDLSVFFKEPIPADLILASNASRPASPVASDNPDEGAEVTDGIPIAGGGGGAGIFDCCNIGSGGGGAGRIEC